MVDDPGDRAQLETFQVIWGVVSEENERGAVVVAAQAVSDELETLVRARLVEPARAKDDEVLGRQKPGETLSARIDLAFRVGAISADLRESLHQLRDLRNKFAHAAKRVSFTNRSVRSKVRTLLERHRDLFDEMWPTLRPKLEKKLGVALDSENGSSLSKMLNASDYKLVFSWWASILAGALRKASVRVERIEATDNP